MHTSIQDKLSLSLVSSFWGLSLTLEASHMTHINTNTTRIILTLTSFTPAYFTGGPDHDRLGFRYWKHPGPFVEFDGVFGRAHFQLYQCQIAAAEAKNPRCNMPRA